uniref:Uncharacterized protein n=1 Tax=Proboscia inermis TaxID=420281 RepID=A0A6T8KUM2_9STRA
MLWRFYCTVSIIRIMTKLTHNWTILMTKTNSSPIFSYISTEIFRHQKNKTNKILHLIKVVPPKIVSFIYAPSRSGKSPSSSLSSSSSPPPPMSPIPPMPPAPPMFPI